MLVDFVKNMMTQIWLMYNNPRARELYYLVLKRRLFSMFKSYDENRLTGQMHAYRGSKKQWEERPVEMANPTKEKGI